MSDLNSYEESLGIDLAKAEDLIKELEAELKEQALQYLSDTGQLGERIGELTEVLEATKDKLAKAVDVLGYYALNDDGGSIARTTISELKGQDDE